MKDSIYTDPIALTMDEKLKDLRKEKGWLMKDLEGKTQISKSTLSRYESDPDYLIPYQDLLKFVEIYDVSLDYLCGNTLQRKQNQMPIDELNLTAGAMKFLKSNENIRLLNELLSCVHFPKLLELIEFFVSGEFQAEVSDMHALHSLSLKILDNSENKEPIYVDDVLFNQAEFDNTDYQRFIITEQFNIIVKQILRERKKNVNAGSVSKIGIVRKRINGILKSKKINVKPSFSVLCQILGVNLEGVSKEDIEVFKGIVTSGNLYRIMNNQKSVPMNKWQEKKVVGKKNGRGR
ncbi:MAG: helix-turn-helix transcriptional regulator [Clostridia bacterium]